MKSKTPSGAWTETVLYSFAGSPNDGANPLAGVAIGSDGSLYGTAAGGGTGECTIPAGPSGRGTVFVLTPPVPGGAWTETVLHAFGAAPDGCAPYRGLVVGRDGALYGTTFAGGISGNGTVFELEPPQASGGTWKENVLHRFKYHDGTYPKALVVNADGKIYGTALNGGHRCSHFYGGCGTVFELDPPDSSGGKWRVSVPFTFRIRHGGGFAPDGLALDRNGVLYGTTSLGGRTNGGTAFELKP